MYNKILMSSIVDPDPRTRIEENSIFFSPIKNMKVKTMLFVDVIY